MRASSSHRAVFVLLAAFSLAAVLVPAVPAQMAKAATFSNAAIADVALSYVGGGNACQVAGKSSPAFNDFECKTFVNCVVFLASGGPPNGVWPVSGSGNLQQDFAAFGVEVTPATATKGDIGQVGTDLDGLTPHTFIVVANLGGGTFDVVDSNAPGHAYTVAHHPYTPDPSRVRYWRLGQMTTGPLGGVGGAVSPAAQGTTVTITAAGGVTQTTYTDSSGRYAFPSVPAGPATIRGSRNGMVGQVSLTIVANFSLQAPTIVLANQCLPASRRDRGPSRRQATVNSGPCDGPPPPTSEPVVDGIQVVSVSALRGSPGQKVCATVVLKAVSRTFDPARGDHLHAVPEGAQALGAWPVQAVKSFVGVGGTYTFNDPSFCFTVPNSNSTVSNWRMRIGGAHVGPTIAIGINAGTAPSPDASPPSLSITGGPTGCTASVPPPVTVSANDDRTTSQDIQFAYRIDGGAWSAFRTGTTIALAATGTGAHTVDVVARDGSGNQSGVASRTWETDATPPRFTLVTLTGVRGNVGPDGVQWFVASPVTVHAEAADEGCGSPGLRVDYKLDSAASIPFSSDIVVTGDLRHSLLLMATDGVGNKTSSPLTVAIDSTPPVTTLAVSAGVRRGPTDTRLSISIQVLCNDATSGCYASYYAPPENPTAFSVISGPLQVREEVRPLCATIDEDVSASGAVYSRDIAGNAPRGSIGIVSGSVHVRSTANLTSCSTPAPGTPYTFTSRAIYTSGGGIGSYALDSNPSTAWYSDATTPASASWMLDMMSQKPVGRIAILAASNGSVGDIAMQVSVDRITWITIGTFSSGSPSSQQEGWANSTIRYLRLLVSNPASVAQIAGIAEVIVYAP